MNKLFHLAHWLLVAIFVISLIVAAQTGYGLWQTNKVNNFIKGDVEFEQVPEHLKSQFAHAYREVQNDQSDFALARLTTVLATEDPDLEAAAYFNRGNIHLRHALATDETDTARISFVGLAKQDYRNALLLNSSLWDARYNLELALLIAPEEPPISQTFDKSKARKGVVVQTTGFVVDLP